MKRKILITNDDGVEAEGLRALVRSLDDLGEIYVIAPDRERSATSMTLTIHRDLRMDQLDERVFSVDGFPADCVNLGINSGLFPEFDLVVSGINHGPNLGDDVHYSGTVAGARQAAVHNLKAVAISSPVEDELTKDDDMRRPAAWLVDWLGRHWDDLKARVVYNVNYPQETPDARSNGSFPAELFTYQGRRHYHDAYDALEEGENWWRLRLKETELGHIREDRSDFEAVLAGCVSITPLSTYTTHTHELKEWWNRTPNANE